MSVDPPAADRISEDFPPLRPHETVQKFLISTTAPLTDRFVSLGLIADEAHPGLRHTASYARRGVAGGRTAITLSFRAERQADLPKFIIPNYEHVAEMMCAYLAVLYGKRFDNHGAFEGAGLFYLPDLRAMDAFADPNLPTNHDKARADFPVPLSLTQIERLSRLLFFDPGRSPAASVFRNAAKFYLRALQTAEADVEMAYLHLITCGEILSSASEVCPDQLLDAQTRHMLTRIEAGLPDGAAVAKTVRSKLRSIRRRFIWTFTELTDPGFFTRGESKEPWGRLRSERYLKTLAAAYDLRSRYVHTGQGFGDLVQPRGAYLTEVQTGKPIVDDKAFGKILADAPTFTGLERIVRYGLLRFAQARLEVGLEFPSEPADVAQALADPPPV
ncbi:hypothetical protein ASD47_01625 [Caulobacter sp. Root1472]|nr:hypothetical protein ASD47_01625 [Caulobacter sp. Root1472]